MNTVDKAIDITVSERAALNLRYEITVVETSIADHKAALSHQRRRLAEKRRDLRAVERRLAKLKGTTE